MAFEAFGVRVRVTADRPEILERIPALLPPGAQPCSIQRIHESFGVLTEADGSLRFEMGESPVTKGIDYDFAIQLLETQLRMYVGMNAPGLTFVHAGVVAKGDRALVTPGLSFTGKTRLTLALIRAGATYYSDEFAVIDEEGLVRPFPKALSVRDGQEVQRHQSAESLGAVTGDGRLPIGAVIFTEYRPGATWNPSTLSLGEGVLRTIGNTLGARDRAEQSMQYIKRAIQDAVLLESARGEADEVAEQMLATVSG